MAELVDVRADAIAPGEVICLNGAAIVVTGIEKGARTVDLHTCYGPAIRVLHADMVPVVVPTAFATDLTAGITAVFTAA